MHAEVGFKLHPHADSDPQTSAVEKNTDTKTKHKNVEKSEIDMKQGSRNGSQGHPPPWFETHCQVVSAEFFFMRHPLAQILRVRPVVKSYHKKIKIMRTLATGAHAEEHVERRCEANNCHRSAL